MNHTISVYCPVYEAMVCSGSYLLEKISLTSQFFICCIGEHRNLETVEEVIQIGDKNIEQEINYLLDRGLVDIQDNEYLLTEVGMEYYKLINLVNEYSEKGIPCLLNKINGQLYLEEGMKLYHKNEIEKDGFILEGSFSSILIGNDNFSNSLQILKEQINCAELKSEYLQDLYARVEISSKEKVYLKFNTDFETAEDIQNKENGILFEISYLQREYKKYYTELDTFRSVVFTLEQLFYYDEQHPYDANLLSENAIKIVEKYQQEKQENHLTLIFNQFTKTIEKKFAKSCQYTKKEKVYSLNPKEIIISLNKHADQYRFEPIPELDIEKKVVRRIAKFCFRLETDEDITL